ncbi:uncharacterized protein LOC143258035 [Tachypleus tridentatus]|uniref:uncharacterized protein LOC143258035 n=1 Tax=Tachypleus tridentatus TaxID=6853 RepID=UPI003FD1AC5B
MVTTILWIAWYLTVLLDTTQTQSCGPRMSARLMKEIPCDMSKISYCSFPGSAYPWQAVRRYIHNNQGLVRRMYGDQRYSFVIQEDIETQRQRYINIPSSPNFRKQKAAQEQSNTRQQEFSQTVTTFPLKWDPKSTTEITVTTHSAGPQDDQVIVTSRLDEADPKTELLTSSAPFTDFLEMVETVATFSSDTEPTSSFDTAITTTNFNDTEQYSTTPEDKTTTTVTVVPHNTTTSTSRKTEIGNLTAGSTEFLHDAKNSENDNSTNNLSYYDKSEMEGKNNAINSNKFDSAKKRHNRPLLKTGVNACPVKEEITAPYWANNTRGETLALLNVYPFEQYVHWEKCAFENHQMFCRKGCRCEQQYQLHRLLALDPKNECRGIFSDWFQFPSSCLCICYDLSMEVLQLRVRTGRQN